MTTARYRSLDILRGAVMVLMAIDHVRVYSGMPAGGTTAGIFFTRWITHYCAPAFVFLAGTAAFFYGRKTGSRSRLAQYLVTRGLFLVLLELTLIRLGWTFNLDLDRFMLAGVIWMLGWCMVLLAVCVWWRPAVVGFLGLAIIAGQHLFAYLPGLVPASSRETFRWFWDFFYPSGSEDHAGIAILYVLIPWIGVMMTGYGFGTILLMEPARRRKVCYWIGLSAIGLFLVIGSVLVLRKPVTTRTPPFLFRLLNQQKYPPSILYLLMTLGPLIALVPRAEKVKGWMADKLEVVGRVPLFYYFLHIPLIHVSALIMNMIKYGSVHSGWYDTAPFTNMPPEYRWGLPLLYLVYVLDVCLLYVACRWYGRYKFSHPEKRWLKYL